MPERPRCPGPEWRALACVANTWPRECAQPLARLRNPFPTWRTPGGLGFGRACAAPSVRILPGVRIRGRRVAQGTGHNGREMIPDLSPRRRRSVEAGIPGNGYRRNGLVGLLPLALGLIPTACGATRMFQLTGRRRRGLLGVILGSFLTAPASTDAQARAPVLPSPAKPAAAPPAAIHPAPTTGRAP